MVTLMPPAVIYQQLDVLHLLNTARNIFQNTWQQPTYPYNDQAKVGNPTQSTIVNQVIKDVKVKLM